MIEIKKLEGKSNPKLAKKIARYLIEDKFTYEQYHEYRDEFHAIHEAFLSFLKTDLTMASIVRVFAVLEVVLDVLETQKAVNMIKSTKSVMSLFDSFAKAYRKSEYGKYTYLILKLILNHWLLENGYSLLIFYPSFTKGLEHLISEAADDESIVSLLMSFYHESYVRNTVYPVETMESVIKKLLSVKETLELQHGIIKISMFGSYTKGTQNEFSDVDLFIKAKTTLSEFEIEAINTFLSQIIGIRVNVALDDDFVHYQMVEVY
ncbi:MAG: nucleotidyltransferase domain-containing protein [Erysipelotrichaceae bacterium]|jgi:predicted nucleotidyltransferase|nr:nucleotidyltransferase domain-containing protein [Erysipelotrichaceae bacterium]